MQHIINAPELLVSLPATVYSARSHTAFAYSINETHYAAKAGSYYGWSTPYNYLDAYQMQLDTNVLVNGSCLASNDTYDMVVCPANTYKLAQSAIAGLCNARGLPCPTVSTHPPPPLPYYPPSHSL